ncbi:MAG TPA: 4-hydroxythreonine-4-phosphate dehydrogenase PdxA [Flavobacterium sp.]|nr:4-hydroxythreonine-4-phosphate dehydrogenase PdxA [Flavobacterium sp.]
MVKTREKIIVGISVGDMNGIGPEIILKTFEDMRMLELCTPVLFANSRVFTFIKKYLRSKTNFVYTDQLDRIQHGKFNIFNTWNEPVDINFGKRDTIVGGYAIESFTSATQALKDEKIDVLVTAPIDKHNVQSDKFHFPGHTDYLNQELDGEALMLMVNGGLRVGLLTEHLPLSEVTAHITPQKITEKVKIIHHSLIQDFNILKPRIAILGLNPHNGDHGVIGDQDDTIIKPTVEKLFEDGYLVSGPFPADGFFGSALHEKFDGVLACYHDQGLVPFKTLSFGKGVNFTAGLDKIRTSPDHGTAFDIAGKGIADFSSFREAVYAAIDIYNNRVAYEESKKNPLKINNNSRKE